MLSELSRRPHRSENSSMRREFSPGSFPAIPSTPLRTRERRVKARSMGLLLFSGVLLVVLVIVILLWQSSPNVNTGARGEHSACNDKLRLPGNVGFSNPPLESTVLFFFDDMNSDERGLRGNERAGRRGDHLQRWFAMLSEAFFSVRPVSAAGTANATAALSFPSSAEELNTAVRFLVERGGTAWVVNRTRGEARPLQMDVVYTYVNESTAGFAARRRQRRLDDAHTKFFRDWGELRYSLRSLWHAVLDPSNVAMQRQHAARQARDEAALAALGLSVAAAAVNAASSPSPLCAALRFSLIRRVILVVAAQDQIPHWVSAYANASCGVEVVQHAALFTAAEQADGALPTFNSLAIESTLHRILNLSRFWWYFNNDMLLGRPLTLFDLFRPLSPPRQLIHFQWRPARLGHRLATKPLPWEDGGSTHAWPQGCAAMWLEPFIHSDHSDHNADFAMDLAEPLEHAVWSSYLQSLADPYLLSGSLQTIDRMKQCVIPALDAALAGRHPPWRTTTFTAPVATRPPRACRNALNRHAHYVAKTALEGVPPTMIYAHLPQVIDTDVYTHMLEDPVDGLTDEARRIRLSFLREMNNFSPVHVYGHYALAMRRAWTRAAWLQLGEALGSSVLGERRDTRTAAPLRQHGFSFCDACPLCTHTNAVSLQHPGLLRELAAWWPPSTLSERLEARACGEDDLGRDGSLLTLKRDYLALIGVHHADGVTVEFERLKSLLGDAFHHGRGQTLNFLKVEDLLQLAMKVHLTEEAVRNVATPPLFRTINDDMPNEQVHAARSDPQNWYRHTRLFDRLLSLSAYHGDTISPFERGEEPMHASG